MQIVSNGDNLHEMSNLFSGENKKNTFNLSSAEFAQRVIKVKAFIQIFGEKEKYGEKNSRAGSWHWF